MRESFWPLFTYQIAALVAAIAQLMYKKGAALPKRFNPPLILGFSLYFIVILLFVLSFKLGGELSVLYPTYAATFAWALIIGKLFYGEKISILKIVGILLIAGGIYFVTIR